MAAPDISDTNIVLRTVATVALFTLSACGPDIGDGWRADRSTDTGDTEGLPEPSAPPSDLGGCEAGGGVAWCPCYDGDLDGDGTIDPGGECFAGLICDMSTITCLPL